MDHDYEDIHGYDPDKLAPLRVEIDVDELNELRMQAELREADRQNYLRNVQNFERQITEWANRVGDSAQDTAKANRRNNELVQEIEKLVNVKTANEAKIVEQRQSMVRVQADKARLVEHNRELVERSGAAESARRSAVAHRDRLQADVNRLNQRVADLNKALGEAQREVAEAKEYIKKADWPFPNSTVEWRVNEADEWQVGTLLDINDEWGAHIAYTNPAGVKSEVYLGRRIRPSQFISKDAALTEINKCFEELDLTDPSVRRALELTYAELGKRLSDQECQGNS